MRVVVGSRCARAVKAVRVLVVDAGVCGVDASASRRTWPVCASTTVPQAVYPPAAAAAATGAHSSSTLAGSTGVDEAWVPCEATAASSVGSAGGGAAAGPDGEQPATTSAAVPTRAALALTIVPIDVRCMDVPSWLPR